MKKVILKTALITLSVALILAVSVFGIVSLSAPYAMMKFTASMGLDSVSGDYAFQEYERSGNIECLVRSFLIAAEDENYTGAKERFGKMQEEKEKVEAYFAEAKAPSETDDRIPAYSLRDYAMGRAACVKYALKEEDAVSFAVAETGEAFPEGNPVAALTVAAAGAKDKETCAALLAAIRAKNFAPSAYYNQIVTILEGVQ